MEIKPVAYIHTDFKEKFGIPRQSGRVPQLLGRIVFEKEFADANALRGIEGFSHLWLIFDFEKARKDTVSLTVRPPRLGGNKRVGVFASRSPYRPNHLGLSVVKLERVEHDKKCGPVLIVSGVDILDNTPIYDIKPYLPYADCINDAFGGYSEETYRYRLNVDFPSGLLNKIPKEKQEAVLGCLKEDPRPSYHEDGRAYSMAFSDFDIHFKVEDKNLFVIGVENLRKLND